MSSDFPQLRKNDLAGPHNNYLCLACMPYKPRLGATVNTILLHNYGQNYVHTRT